MRACLHCRSYLWNWAILNGALWLKEAGKEVIKAETTDKLNSDIRCIIGREKYIFFILPSPLNKWAVNLYSCIFFSWAGLYISKVILERMKGKKKKKNPKAHSSFLQHRFSYPNFKKGLLFWSLFPSPPPYCLSHLSYWGIWSKDSQGAKYILIRTLEAAINEIQLSQTVAITGSDSFI